MGEDFTAKDFRTWGGTLARGDRVWPSAGPAETEAQAKQAVDAP